MSMMGTEGGGTRVAVRTDPLLGTREDALFLPAHRDELFCMLHRPAGRPRGGVVICCSLYAEQLKLYRTEVLAARALAADGFAVARFHYRGTGHSGGLFETATVGTMLEDTAIVAGFLRQGIPRVPLAFMGARWGGLIASLAAEPHAGAPLVLWEPILQGTRFFREMLRARQMSTLAGGARAGATGGWTVEDLHVQGWIDAMGYPIHRALYESAHDVGATASRPFSPRPLLLIQVSRRTDLHPEAAALRDACAALGSQVVTERINAEEAWSFIGSPLRSSEALISATRSFLAQAILQSGPS